jgi:hypothetical protein
MQASGHRNDSLELAHYVDVTAEASVSVLALLERVASKM